MSMLPDWIGWLIGAAVALAATWFGGRMSGKTAAKVDGLKSYKKTRERMDDADQGISDDPAAIRGRLRERGKR